eukprot:m.742542 g.742542  ORF g.742542 m.742542 type:complete len:70 (+) comp23118_c0_seq34:903-1112(+)
MEFPEQSARCSSLAPAELQARSEQGLSLFEGWNAGYWFSLFLDTYVLLMAFQSVSQHNEKFNFESVCME